MKKCWQIKNCPASRFETSCKAFNAKLNCWEVEDTMCKVHHGNDVCAKCEVYLQKKGAKEEISRD